MLIDDFPFDPFFLFKSPLYQTLMGWLINIPTSPKSSTKFIHLPDEDIIAMEVTTPKGWKNTDLTVVMVHGLCGSHKSMSLMRMAKRLEKNNIRAIRLNLRGCGSGRGLAKSTYHSGRTDDVFEALKILKMECPTSPIILIGFSMGGNIVLKLMGELANKASTYIEKAIALSPPVDMKESIKLFHLPENKHYSRYFSKLLREDIEFMKRKFPDFPRIELPPNLTLDQFNRLFIVPFFGFDDVEDYYRFASSKYVLSNIKVPCKVLLSKDDPIVSWRSFSDLDIPENMDVYITNYGGHLGYLGKLQDKRGFYWLDNVLLEWISK